MYRNVKIHKNQRKIMNLREKMFNEIKEKSIFKQVQEYSFDYLDNVNNRSVYPKNEALKKLDNFSEILPLKGTNASEVLEFLNSNGAEATVAQQGGRYFGFVCGSTIPTSLAARVLSDFWDQNSAINVLSPIASKLEDVCENWLKELFGLPENTPTKDKIKYIREYEAQILPNLKKPYVLLTINQEILIVKI